MEALAWDRVRSAFRSALELPPEQRRAWLVEHCQGDAALLAEAQSLLDHALAKEGFLEPPSSVQPPEVLDATLAGRLIGAHVGPYTVVELLGSGAMGFVYDAEQANPRRRVALKVLRASAYLDELTPRLFQREVEALARMQHPGIAGILDAGRTDDGCWYFAMEKVDGLPLTRFASERELSMGDRLELFGRICEAVHYAHQRGVIHRDLKPSNILVTSAGLPKLLDFGLARVTDAETASTDATRPGSFRGTLAYASPEQALGRSDDIDARCDVYALGVILYELLTGRLPFQLEGLTLLEAARVISEEPPIRASAIRHELRGDPETILGKALEKDPARRYASAAALAEDVDRYAKRQPILARRPTAAYQLRLLFARHRLVSVLAAALFVIVVGSAMGLGVLAVGLKEQRDVAQRAEAIASRESAAAEEFATFLESLFGHADARSEAVKEPSLRQVLDDGYARLASVEQPVVRARLMHMMGRVYDLLGERQRSRELLESARDIRRSMEDVDPFDLAETLQLLARALQEHGDLEAADAAAAEALEIVRRHTAGDDERVASAWNIRGQVHWYGKDVGPAIEYFGEALEIRRRLHDGPHPNLAASLGNLGLAIGQHGDPTRGEALLREALEMRKALGDTAETILTLDNLAHLVLSRDMQESERLFAEELALARECYRPGHPKIAWVLTEYATPTERNHGPEAATPLLREAVAIHREAEGTSNRIEMLRNITLLAKNLLRTGERDEPLALQEEIVQMSREIYGPDHQITRSAEKSLESLYATAGGPADGTR